jgi:hypothetical protein
MSRFIFRAGTLHVDFEISRRFFAIRRVTTESWQQDASMMRLQM